MSYENVFVTVGTTKFDALIERIGTPETHQALQKLGCQNLTIQHGRGTVDEAKLSEVLKDVNVKTYELKSSIAKDISQADLVISHAGAGSCIEILRAGKHLLVVINEDLADNHQIELAEQLCNDGYLFFCTPKRLSATLMSFDSQKLKKYEDGNVKAFVQRLDQLMGFEQE